MNDDKAIQVLQLVEAAAVEGADPALASQARAAVEALFSQHLASGGA